MAPPDLSKAVLKSPHLPDADVAVTTKIITAPPIVCEHTAQVGSTTVTERHTIGNADGTGPLMTTATLAQMIQDTQQQTADRAAWAESALQTVKQLFPA